MRPEKPGLHLWSVANRNVDLPTLQHLKRKAATDEMAAYSDTRQLLKGWLQHFK
tara:strand:- start:6029 stop:6190 length:162 start_codon:yes stop_codon:yes gene_type:complete